MNNRAHARMQRAKQLYTRAAKATLDRLPLAEAMTKVALEELNAARAELQAGGGDDLHQVLNTFDGPAVER